MCGIFLTDEESVTDWLAEASRANRRRSAPNLLGVSDWGSWQAGTTNPRLSVAAGS
jgi:hypothetical protein